MPSASAGRITSSRCCCRAANIINVSARNPALVSGFNKISRKASPTGVPPGSRVNNTGRSRDSNHWRITARLVDLPAPSMPSRVINLGFIRSILLRERMFKRSSEKQDYKCLMGFEVDFQTTLLIQDGLIDLVLIHRSLYHMPPKITYLKGYKF